MGAADIGRPLIDRSGGRQLTGSDVHEPELPEPKFA